MPRLRLDPFSPTGLAVVSDQPQKRSLGYVTDRVTGMIGAGTNITITGTGTKSDPYLISSSGGSGASDATTTSKGIVQLAGDLGGTAASPTVPGLATKEPSITAGTTSQYWRGDKSWQTLDKTAVGLANVDNTADVNKVVLSAGKLTTSRAIDGIAFDGSADISLIAPATHAATSKVTPVDADEMAVTDSAASFVLKKLTWANLKATIKSYYDSVVSTLTNKDLTSATNTFPTFNQNTTGSAATLTTARNIDGQSFNGSADITVIAPGTHAATSKVTPADADELPIVDSAALNVLKKLTWANLKAAIKSYYDSVSSTVTNKDLSSTTNTMPSGTTMQVQYSLASAVATGTTVLPSDDTIPQNTEGDQYMSVSITPKATTNILVIDVVTHCSHSVATTLTHALFQDTTAGALAANSMFQGTGTGRITLHLTYVVAAGTTSATTFKVRAGGGAAGTMTFNGSGGTRIYGGITNSMIKVTEYKA